MKQRREAPYQPRCFSVYEESPMTKALKTMPIKSIIPYDNNPRHNDNAVDAVAESIRQCEYIAPIIVDEDGVILAGHTRLKAMQKLGKTEAEVMQVTGLTEAQKKKYRLLDNKTNEFAGWDIDLLELELSDLDFDGFDFGFDIESAEEQQEIKEVKYHEKISVVIDCENDEEAETIFTQLTEEGYKCHISTL